MARSTFDYQAVLADPESDEVTSIVAFREVETGFQAILWHATREEWIWAPATVLALLNDDEYAKESTGVDRETAERLALRYLPEPLPSIDRLEQMIEEAGRTGQRPHPPQVSTPSDTPGRTDLSPLRRAIRDRVEILRSRDPDAPGEPLPPLLGPF